jgi:TetR/AcrR family transcriptional regulator
MGEPVSRKQLILESLARELERSPGERITTAVLARACGVSEAALYRHFPSKARMFEALIGFAEETVFARINRILVDETDARSRCAKVLYLLLGFSGRNPGITRVLLGDALIGEQERLHARVEQFFARLETQMRQILRETRLRGDAGLTLAPETAANLLLAWAEGLMHQFLRTRFRVSPLEQWETQWPAVSAALFEPVRATG